MIFAQKPAPLLSALLFVALGTGLQSCGGVKREAKVATALQTLLANTTTALINNGSNTTELTFNCGASASDGTLSYSIPAGLKTPADIAAYLYNGGSLRSVVGLDVTFANCKVSACGDSLVFNGTGSSIGITLGTLVAFSNAAPDAENSLALSISAHDQAVSGLIDGKVTFSYKLESIYKVQPSPTLVRLQVNDADTPTPLENGGQTYSGSEIDELADGC